MPRALFACLVLFVLLGCNRLPGDISDLPELKAFNGSWVVDMEASLAQNPGLMEDLEQRLYLRQLVMVINMESREITMGHGRQQNRDPYKFIVLSAAPGQALLKLEAGLEVKLVKENDKIIYLRHGHEREILVFKPMKYPPSDL